MKERRSKVSGDEQVSLGHTNEAEKEDKGLVKVIGDTASVVTVNQARRYNRSKLGDDEDEVEPDVEAIGLENNTVPPSNVATVSAVAANVGSLKQPPTINDSITNSEVSAARAPIIYDAFGNIISDELKTKYDDAAVMYDGENDPLHMQVILENEDIIIGKKYPSYHICHHYFWNDVHIFHRFIFL